MRKETWIEKAAKRIAEHESAESASAKEVKAIADIIRDCFYIKPVTQ